MIALCRTFGSRVRERAGGVVKFAAAVGLKKGCESLEERSGWITSQ